MDTQLMLNLADGLAFVGLAGTALAIISSLAAAIAFAIIGAPAVGGAATVGWLVALVLSLCNGFAGNWLLPLLALAALPLFLVLAWVYSLVRVTLPRPATGRVR